MARDRNRPPSVPLQLRVLRGLFATLGRVFPRRMGGWAYDLWFRTRRHPDSGAGRQAAARARRETLTVNDVPVAVYRWGAGPVVLFVHGWSGRGTQVAAFIEPLTRAGYCVVSVDAPGHGDTPGERTDILECVAVLQALAQACGPLHGVITHSFGGMVLAYALNHGLTAGRAVCLSPPARMEFLVERFTGILHMPPAVVADLRRRLEARFDASVWEAISTDSNARHLAIPALIIHDENDEGVPWQQGQRVAQAWPGARFLKTQGLGHNRILRDPETVRTVVGFLTAGSGRSGADSG